MAADFQIRIELDDQISPAPNAALLCFTEKVQRDIAAAFFMPIPEERPPLTAETILRQIDDIRARDCRPARVICTPMALEPTQERLFPESRHRSARIRKKLIKRHGGEFRMRPAIWRVENVIFAHPALRPQIEALRR